MVKIDNAYWLKYGLKQNGELVCIRMLAKTKPFKGFYYTENGEVKGIKDPNVIRITRQMLDKIAATEGGENENSH